MHNITKSQCDPPAAAGERVRGPREVMQMMMIGQTDPIRQKSSVPPKIDNPILRRHEVHMPSETRKRV